VRGVGVIVFEIVKRVPIRRRDKYSRDLLCDGLAESLSHCIGVKQPRFSAGHPEPRARSGTKVTVPVHTLCASLQLMKRAGVKFGDSDNYPTRCSQMEIERINLGERSRNTHATLYDLGRAETEIPNFRCENLFQSRSRNYENAERVCCSRSAQRIIL
jgi:hypothetical protein